MSDIAQSAELIHRGDPERFATAMTARAGADRDALMVLYAFNLEVARAPYVTAEPMIAQMRLQWWRDAVEEIFSGGRVRRHEVVSPLADLVARAGLPRAPFDAIIDAREWDIARDPFGGVAALEAHLDATGGALMELGVGALGGDGAAGRVYGRGVALANWLRAYPAVAGSGRTPLPPLSGQDLKGLLERGAAALDAGRQKRPGGVAALRMGYLSRGVLGRALEDPDAIPDGRLEPSEFVKRGRLLWLAATGRY